ncbi:MAG: S-adenosylmethionine:tRNA ribosyltransferase-isomerase [Bacteroidales bacterium]
MNPEKFTTDEFSYPLPDERIAQYPLPERDASQLLVYRNQTISDHTFRDLPELLPSGSLLISNQTRVVRARLIFRKLTGARIEIFCLEPVNPVKEVETAYQSASGIEWKCLVGNARRWKEGTLELSCMGREGNIMLRAQKTDTGANEPVIRFTWEPAQLSFAEVLEAAGKIPLPPYMHREPEDDDTRRYQTVFAKQNGSVAAPTAGLHFTPEILKMLNDKGIGQEFVTLHVGAGTFAPVRSNDISGHVMHTEEIHIPARTVERLARHDGPVVATGTTTLRTLESLYWHGVQLIEHKSGGTSIRIGQWTPYDFDFSNLPDRKTASEAVLNDLQARGVDSISGTTQLIIVPGYPVQMADVLITNFHMPRSTLLMLVAAFIGRKEWKRVYHHALEHSYRFLSYGDSCLFFRH